MLRLDIFENLYILREVKNYEHVREWKERTHKTRIVSKGMKELPLFIANDYGLSYGALSNSFNPLGLKWYQEYNILSSRMC